jgi:anti-sigma B factor antagonist
MTIETQQQTLLISHVRELTAANARECKQRIAQYLSPSICNIEFDGSSLQFLDSSGLGALLSLKKMASSFEGKFQLRSPSSALMQILKLTQLQRVMPLAP